MNKEFIKFLEEYIQLVIKYDITFYGWDDGLHISKIEDYEYEYSWIFNKLFDNLMSD